jgi:hypothetical protein
MTLHPDGPEAAGEAGPADGRPGPRVVGVRRVDPTGITPADAEAGREPPDPRLNGASSRPSEGAPIQGGSGATDQDLIDLHSAWWSLEAERPIVNDDCGLAQRFRHVPALPDEWLDRDGMLLEPEALRPDRLQPGPIVPAGASPTRGRAAFNTLFPYHRVPWLVGIVGCGLRVSTVSQTVWPVEYLGDDWFSLPNHGFSPRMDWLAKLLEFLSFIVDRYHPARCVPTLDMISRGPGDLLIAAMGAERCYLEFYDHPREIKSLLGQITELYIHWARVQLAALPTMAGGYCNQYGLWSPGTTIRMQEDYAVNLSYPLFREFLLPSISAVVDAFDFHVLHTHSAGNLAEWALDLPRLGAIEMTLDPAGPAVETLIPRLLAITARKPLIVLGVLTERQVSLLTSNLPPGGLMLDVDVVPEGTDTTAGLFVGAP